MALPFIESVHRLTQKEKCLVAMDELKYGNPTKAKKRGGYKTKRINNSMLLKSIKFKRSKKC